MGAVEAAIDRAASLARAPASEPLGSGSNVARSATVAPAPRRVGKDWLFRLGGRPVVYQSEDE